MSNKFHLEIKDFGKINKANIEINKINIIGGINSSGKTTISKLLYCFLKANSIKTEDYVKSGIIDTLEKTTYYTPRKRRKTQLSKSNDIDYIITEYEKIRSKNEEDLKLINKKFSINKIRKYLKIIDGINIKYAEKNSMLLKTIHPIIKAIKENNNKTLFSYVVAYMLSEESLKPPMEELNDYKSHIDYIKFYNNRFGITIDRNLEEEYCLDDNQFIYHTTGVIEEKSLDAFYIGAISLFDLDKYYSRLEDKRKQIFRYEEHIEYLIKNLEPINQYKIDLYNNLKEDHATFEFGFSHRTKDEELLELSKILNIPPNDLKIKIIIVFEEEGKKAIQDLIAYINKNDKAILKDEEDYLLELLKFNMDITEKDGNFLKLIKEGMNGGSIFYKINRYYEKLQNKIEECNSDKEKEELEGLKEEMDMIFDLKLDNLNKEIPDFLLNKEYPNEDDEYNLFKEDEIDGRINKVKEKIGDIIQGKFTEDIYYKFTFKQEDYHYPTVRISSGIKQVGILQLLLINKKLNPGTFLIIDEPEVNLHPEWQFKFAEILVVLAKELDVTIYLNTHSPMFIESIQAFTEYYDMENDINYYLTEESENKGKYDFNKIKSDELYKLYDNLGNPYDLIDQLRLKKRLGE